MYSAGWAIWVVGLPGSGKSSLAKGLYDHLSTQGQNVVMLEMDKQRKQYFPDPTYSAQERERAYGMFVDEAADLVKHGRMVIMDGSAYQVAMRTYARQRIPRFAEIFVSCQLDEATRREALRPQGAVMAGLYAKAIERQQTGKQFDGLGEVIGVDVEFEVDPNAELIIDNTRLTKEETLGKALHFLDSWLASA